MEDISIMIVEDQALLRQAWTALISNHSSYNVGEYAETEKAAISIATESKPDVILMDIRLKEGSGLEATKLICNQLAKTRVIILSTFDSMNYVRKAFSYGAKGFLTKNASKEELFNGINSVLEGKTFISQAIKDEHFERMSGIQPNSQTSLTNREITIAKLVAQGLTSCKIGEKLFISTRTVETHRGNILKKLAFQNSAQLSRWVFENGFSEC